MFRVTQQIEFCYGHRLLHYNGKCRFLHGHNGKAIISLEGSELDARGMLMDFSDIKRVLRTWIDTEFDHRMILHQDDPLLPLLQAQNEPILVFSCNPTAENIARTIYDYAVAQGFPVSEVTLWETPNSYATYTDRR